jgi:hypothetical protein
MEVIMIGKIAALTAALLLASAMTASAQPSGHNNRTGVFAPGNRAYESELSPPRSDHQYCYLPSETCDNDHTVTN